MHALLFALALAAHAPAPQTAVLAPHGKDLQQARAFLLTASAYAPALSPGPLGRSLGSALLIDALDPATWADAGLDPDGPVSLLEYSDGWAVLVFSVKDAAKVVARARAAIVGPGVAVERQGGTTAIGAVVMSTGPRPQQNVRVVVSARRAALVLQGACSLAPSSFHRCAEALTVRPSLGRAKGLAGALTVVGRDRNGSFAAGLAPSAQSLAVDARLWGRAAVLVKSGQDRFGALRPEGVVAARADLAAPALAQVRAQADAMLRMLVNRAGGPVVAGPLSAVLDELSGPVALLVTGLDPQRGRGDSSADAFFLASHVYAAQVKDAARCQTELTGLVQALENGKDGLAEAPAPVPGLHQKLQVAPNRTLYFGLVDDVLYAADDSGARDALLAALPHAAGPVQHAGTLVLDGSRAASALGRLSILDAARSGPLAALFGLAVEGGPLLQASGATALTADPEGSGVRLRGTLNLAPPPSP